MLLKSIKLSNIRSYLSQKIDFPIGSLLLSGDIGSGKSTILLAIEFALFGSNPAELPASSLLRHGKNEGSVELIFELEGKEIIVKRSLKKGKNGIKQEIGYIITDGIKKELSPVEMKSHVFDLLGYPKDLVSKGKDLIYRYTVYTPQEEMKRIIAEDKEIRLNTLRKVFNIDKYKKIRENTAIFVRNVKEKRKEFEGFISDLEEKRKEFSKINEEVLELNEKLKGILPKAERAKGEVIKKREKISIYENKVNELNKLRKSLEIFELNLNNSIAQYNRNNKDISRLNEHVTALEKDLEKFGAIDSSRLKEEMQNLESNIKKCDKELENTKQKLNECKIRKSNSEETIKKVSEIDQCPLCLQNVEHEHKSSISEKESKKIKECDDHIISLSADVTEKRKLLEDLQKRLELLRKKESGIELVKLKLKNVREKKEEKQSLENEQVLIKEKIGKINAEKAELSKKVEEIKNVEEDYKIVKAQLEIALAEDKKIDIEKAGFEKEKESLDRIMKSLHEEIGKKEKTKQKLSYLSGMQTWLEDYFVELMSTLERHIMMQIYGQFNELFKTWFNVLIEDETISVRLDDEFTPIIEQNGYETFVENLSRGEKNSVSFFFI